MSKASEYLREFHGAFGLDANERPTVVPSSTRNLRHKLQAEETDELWDAMSAEDLTEIADALADIVYVAYGTALEYGIPLDRVLKEVHRSNMTKLGEDGQPVYREDGKVVKGPDYEPPRIAEIIRRAADETEDERFAAWWASISPHLRHNDGTAVSYDLAVQLRRKAAAGWREHDGAITTMPDSELEGEIIGENADLIVYHAEKARRASERLEASE